MEFDFWQLIVAAGVFNEIILAGLLAFQRHNKKASKLLALFLLFMGVNRFNYLFIPGLYYDLEWFTFSRLPTQLTFGFLVWLYVLYITDANYSLQKRHLHLGIPILIDIVYCLGRGLYIYWYKLDEKNDFLYQPFEFLIHEGLAVGYNLFMLYMAFRFLKAQHRRVNAEFSNLDKVHLDWLQWFLRALLLVGIVWTAYYLVEIMIYPNFLNFTHYYAFWILTILVNLSFGYKNLMLTELTYALPMETNDIGHAPYRSSSLQENEVDTLGVQVQELIIDLELYRNPQLRLADVAEASQIPTHQLSQIISQGLNSNFHSLINTLRIQEVKKRLIDSNYEDRSILSIAYDSGFNSKSTFNKIFKSMVGLSPSQYRKRNSS